MIDSHWLYMVAISLKISRKRRVIVPVNSAVYSVSVQNSNKSEEKKKEPNLRSVKQIYNNLKQLSVIVWKLLNKRI